MRPKQQNPKSYMPLLEVKGNPNCFISQNFLAYLFRRNAQLADHMVRLGTLEPVNKTRKISEIMDAVVLRSIKEERNRLAE